MTIHYHLHPAHPEAHLYSVTIEIDTLDPAGQRFTLPNWIPGSYMVRDFAKNIVEINASIDGEPVDLVKLDKSTWQSPPGLSQIRLVYDVYAWDLSVRTAHLDTTHGFFNGTSVFLCVEGQAGEICNVTLASPVFESLNQPAEPWRVATALGAVDVDEYGFGHYQAANYDELIDHPVEMGTFERATFEACGVTHELVLTGQYITDLHRVCADLKVICEYQIRFFGEPAPVDRYVFLVMVVGEGYGGLEHRASTSLLIRRDHLPVPGQATISDNYLEFLGLCSHEYFHTWNVKRIKPACFVPYKLESETHTSLLWAFEGITSYYDDLTLVHCGLIDQSKYLTLLGRAITRVYRGSGRLKQSVGDSSFDAWTKFYKQDENAPNSVVSYYAKGSLVAVCLDMLIREKTHGEKSLRDVMQFLWNKWLETGQGVNEDEIEHVASQICGEDLRPFFQMAVYGTDDLPLDELLNQVGVQVGWRASESQQDLGGTPASTSANSEPKLVLGIKSTAAADGMKITHVYDNGPAQRAGLSAGDTLIAIQNLSVATIDSILSRHKAGDKLRVHLFRRDELMELTIIPTQAPANTCFLTPIPDHPGIDKWLSNS